MKIELEKQEHNLVKMNIEVPAKQAVDYYNRAVQRFAKNVNIPGFRKGRAPRVVVEQNVGVERIKYEALELCLPKVFQEVISENKLDVVAQPTVESYEYNVGEDLKIVANVELRPEVKLGEYKGVKVEAQGYETPEGEFEKMIEDLKSKAVSYEVVVDRPAVETDLMTFDFEGFVNGEKIKNGDGKNYTLDLAHSNFIPGFAEGLVGHSIDEEFEINVKFPETYHEDKLKGQDAIFKIKVHEIKQKVEPELNDEFAKKVGPFETMKDLNEHIQKYLDEKKEYNNKKIAETTLFDKIVENVEVDIQDSMIDREEKVLLEEYTRKLAQQGFTLEQAIAQHGEDLVTKPIRRDAVNRIKNALVIDKIAEVENIKIEKEDMDAKLEAIIQTYGADRMTVMQQLAQNPNSLNAITQQALNEKVIKFLLENNEVDFTVAKSEKSTKKPKKTADENSEVTDKKETKKKTTKSKKEV